MSDGFLCPACSKPVTSTTGCIHFPVRKNEKEDREDPVEMLKNLFNFK